MADTKIAYQEIRFDVRHPELTEVYVYIENLSRDGFPVEGWHHKTFPASMSSIQILQAWADGKEDPVMWPFKVPPTFLERMEELEYQRIIYEINYLLEALLEYQRIIYEINYLLEALL